MRVGVGEGGCCAYALVHVSYTVFTYLRGWVLCICISACILQSVCVLVRVGIVHALVHMYYTRVFVNICTAVNRQILLG